MLNDTGTTVTWSSLVSGVAPQKQVDLQSDLEARKLPMPVTLVDLYKCCSFCYAAPANQSTMTCTAHTHAHTADCVNINSYLEKCFLIGFVCMVLPTTDWDCSKKSLLEQTAAAQCLRPKIPDRCHQLQLHTMTVSFTVQNPGHCMQ